MKHNPTTKCNVGLLLSHMHILVRAGGLENQRRRPLCEWPPPIPGGIDLCVAILGELLFVVDARDFEFAELTIHCHVVHAMLDHAISRHGISD